MCRFRVLSLVWIVFTTTCALEAAEPAVLDGAGIKAMLENLGYEVTEGKYDSGNAWYAIKYPYSGSDWNVTTSGGGDKQLFVVLDFNPYKPEEEIPREMLLKLLQANYTSYYAYISYNPEIREIRIKAVVPNYGVKPAVLREAIQGVVELGHRTADDRSPKRWPKPESKEAPAAK